MWSHTNLSANQIAWRAARASSGKKSARDASAFSIGTAELQKLYVLRLQPFGSFDDIELNRLSFLQAAESVGLYG